MNPAMNPISKRFSSLAWRRLAVLLFLLSTAAAPLLAAGQKYLPAGQPDAVALLAPPPLPGSAEQAADMASTLTVYKARTPDQEAIARSERKFTVFAFAPAVGPFFQPDRLPKAKAFFKQVREETDAVTDTAKNYWKRPRPYMLDPSLAAAGGEMEKSFSYPSGHSTRATVLALLLADLFPNRQSDILAFGRNLGWRRVEIARHYPTDIYAGRVLAQAIVRELKASLAFQHDFEEVKAEVAGVQSSH
jgi:acid phosphatase (class A)